MEMKHRTDWSLNHHEMIKHKSTREVDLFANNSRILDLLFVSELKNNAQMLIDAVQFCQISN